MRKKIMLLVFMLPIILVIVAFSITTTALVKADIPVTGIEITSGKENGYIYLDYTNPYENNLLQVEVFPVNAKNKEFSVSVEPAFNEKKASISVNSDGYINVQGVGKSIIHVKSVDGNFEDRRLVIVGSSKVYDVEPFLIDSNNKKTAILNDSITLNSSVQTYLYMKAIPYNTSIENVKFSSSNENIVTIDKFGKIIAKAPGNAKITIENYDTVKGILKKEITCNVETPTQVDNNLMIQTRYDKGDNDIYHKANAQVTYFINGNLSKDAIITWSCDSDNVEIIPSEDGKYSSIKVLNDVSTTLTVTITDNGTTQKLTRHIVSVRQVDDLIFEKQYEDFGILDVYTVGNKKIENGKYVEDKAVKLFETIGSDFSIYDGGNHVQIFVDETIATPSKEGSLSFEILADGITNIVAKWEYAEYFMEDTLAQMEVKFVKDAINVYDFDGLKQAVDDGKAVVLMNSIELYKENMTYNELKQAVGLMPTTANWQYYYNVEREKTDDIDSLIPEKIRPNVMYVMEFKNDVYGNGFTISANNITTAKYETKMAGTNNRIYKPFFDGPLDFVAMTDNPGPGGEAMSAASVKGQDNISFLVRTPNITLDNVSLMSCNDEYLIQDGYFNLSKLNKVGTTLEILADGVEVRNSRISNGRTVIRTYGGDSDKGIIDGNPVIQSVDDVYAKDERIKVTITNSIVKNGREFLLKIGSNRAVKSDKKRVDRFTYEPDIKPLLDSQGLPYKPGNLNDKVDRKDIGKFKGRPVPTLDDTYFYDKYVTTDVTLKNSILENSGLFSIGIETHFQGQFLQGIADNKINGMLGGLLPTWKELSATSLASVLRLEGQVELLDWKELKNLNSETLIESDAQGLSDFLKLNFVEMIKLVREKHSEYEPLIEEYNGEEYVHGGIALYGGGFNYSLVDISKLDNNYLDKYNINLQILAESKDTILWMQGTALPLAAGLEDFTFFMYGSDGKGSCKNVKERMSNGSAYEWLKGLR